MKFKIGDKCTTNKECINNRCENGICTRKKRDKNNPLKFSVVNNNTKSKSSSNSSKQTVKNMISTVVMENAPLPPITKKTRKKRVRKLLIIQELPIDNNPSKNEFVENEQHLKATSDNHLMSHKRLNEPYIGLMDELYDVMMKQGEPFRARAYKKAQETIMSYPGDILSPDQLKGLPNIGPVIMEKLIEYTNTGTLKILERERNNPANILADIYGVGPKKAAELVASGITSIDALRQNQDKLNNVQKIGLHYYEDILKRIPRSEIDEYETIFNKVFQQVATPHSKFEIVGSYRRGVQTSGDIDMIITADKPVVFIAFIDLLIKHKIIIEVLSKGPTKCLVIAKIPSSSTYRRVDFLYSTQSEYPFSVLYFTGSKMFNTVMRGHALKKGFTMNEHGLYKMDGKKKGDLVDHVFKDEKDIFDFLHLQYVEPTKRIDGRSVIETTNPVINSPIINPPIINPPIINSPIINSPIINPPIINSQLVNPTSTIPSIINPEVINPTINNLIPSVANKTVKKRPKLVENENKNKKKLVIVDLPNTLINQEPPINENTPAKTIIEDFKHNGISVLENLNENQCALILREANKAYYNEQPLMTDNEFDIVKEFIEHKYPTNAEIKAVGAPIERNKVKLPYEMWSMDKIKPDTNALTNWLTAFKGPYILSCKLDGVSGLYTTEGRDPKLYTRGNGKVGQDITHLIPYLRLPKTKNIVIRGEFVINKSTFDTKYKATFANPRNMVAGIINHKTINETIKDVDFVAYEVIKPALKPIEQLELLKTLDVQCVLYKVEKSLTNELLSDTLVDWRKNNPYEIDGVIVANNGVYDRTSSNPEHAFAFKMVLSDQIAEAKVVDVIWTPSKDGYLKPRVRIEPIQLGGVRIEYATGFNGSFIQDNKIGIGALIELIRSGDVIPYIRKVITPSSQPKMPSIPYKWNDTHVDIMLENIEDDQTVREKNITGFFRGIGVVGLSSGNIAKMIKAGYDTVPKIISVSIADLAKIDGFQIKSATKIYTGIHEKIQDASIVTLMSASNVFGRGFSETKIELIMENYPDVLLSNEPITTKVSKLAAIKGMATKTAEMFVEKIPGFIQFMTNAHLEDKLQTTIAKKSYDVSNPLFQKSIVMTGYRDAQLKEQLLSLGAKMGSSISKNTFMVLVKDANALDDDTGKLLEAKKLGVPIMTHNDFIKKYL
jgi:DNA ligase (NAD+)